MHSSLIKKALDKGVLQISLTDIRDFSSPPHNNVDDIPYGGGAGMVMKPEPLVLAIEAERAKNPNALVVLLSASGEIFNQRRAIELSERDLILVCGRYEGIDQRVIELAVDLEISIGDYVLMGGEVAAMAVIEACARLIPGAIGNSESLTTESFNDQNGEALLEAPQYTRPPEFRGKVVPEVLISGDHKKIAAWRKQNSLELTRRRRPELLKEK